MQALPFHWQRQDLLLHPYKALYWPSRKALMLADLHLGKTFHFRREGFAVPAQAGDLNWEKLIALLIDFEPERVLFLGDLFHSAYNPEWEEFGQLREQFRHVSFELIGGNHDILSDHQYERFDILLHGDTLSMEPFLLSHEPLAEAPSGLYNLAGHLDPAVRLQGGGRQRLKLPCFFFGKHAGILPAFGAFTGTALVKPAPGDRVFVVAEEKVIEVS